MITGASCLRYCETKTKRLYREQETQTAVLILALRWKSDLCALKPQQLSLLFSKGEKNDDITVYDGDVSAFVVLRQRHGGPLRRRHNPNCAAAIGALQVGLSTQLRRLDAQTLWQGEGLSSAVMTVGLVPPLHHRGLCGGRLVVAREDRRLEQHRKPLLLPHCDMHTITHTDWHTREEIRNRSGICVSRNCEIKLWQPSSNSNSINTDKHQTPPQSLYYTLRRSVSPRMTIRWQIYNIYCYDLLFTTTWIIFCV